VSSFRLVGFLIALAVAVFAWAATCGAWRLERVAAGVAPLEPRSFPALTLVTLGTGGAHENPDRLGPATAVALGRRVLLVDAGRGLAESLRAARIPTSQPEAVLLTSLLPENSVGLDDLLLTGWLDGRSKPLRVFGPPGTRALCEALAAAHAGAVRARAQALELPLPGASFSADEIGDGWRAGFDALAVRAGELPGGPLAALAYRFESAGRSAVVAGTGWAPEALVSLARGAGLLVHEAVFVPTPELAGELGLTLAPERLRREAALHTAIADVGGLARQAGVGTLALVRLRPPPVFDLQITRVVRESFDGRIVIPDDGDELRP
jgi:ribonuclease Z